MDAIALLALATRVPTSLLSDTLRDQGFPDQALSLGLEPRGRPVPRVAGWATTVRGGPVLPGESGPDLAKADAIDGMGADSIAVWAGGDVHGVCLFGDLLALGMAARGVRAAVVDGGVRDLDDIEEIGLPIFSRYVTPRASTGHWRVRESGSRVVLPGAMDRPVVVDQGDLVVADVNGVVSVPVDVVAPVLEAAGARLAEESTVRGRIADGESLVALLEEFGRL